MKRFGVLFLAAWLAGCASSGGGDDGSAAADVSRSQSIAKIHTELAAAYYERTQYSVSLQEIGIALQADGNYAPAYNVRALVRMALRENELAEEDFRRSLRLDNSSSDTHSNYGWFLCQRGQHKDAARQFQEALKNPLYATPEIAYVNLGICSKKAGQLEDAENNLQRALILRPGMPAALYGLAELRYEGGDYAGAKSFLLRFVQASPELDAEQLWLAVRIERKMRDRNAEANYAMQLRKRYPDSREAQLLVAGE